MAARMCCPGLLLRSPTATTCNAPHTKELHTHPRALLAISPPAPTSSSIASADRPSSMAEADAPGGASARLMRSTEMGAAL